MAISGLILLILILTAIAMLVWAARSFGREKTTIKPFEQSTELVTYGLYRFTRNPMYLSMAMTLFGLALFLGSMTPFLLIPGFHIAHPEKLHHT